MSNFSDVQTDRVLNKKQLFALYGGVDRKTFESWILDIMPLIGWRKGKQVFPPVAVERIMQHIGKP